MLGQPFWHQTLRRYVIAVGTLFNDLHVQRRDADGTIVEDIKVPLAYAPREKTIARLEQDPAFQKQAITLPRMSFEMINMSYAPDRKLPTTQRIKSITIDEAGNSMQYTYIPVPYEINFQLNIFTKYAEDGTQIVEQILPFFTPEWTFSMRLLDDYNFTQDVPLVLQSVISEDTYDGDYESRRAIVWTLDFMLKGVLFGPSKESKIIKQAFVNKYLDELFVDKVQQTRTRPGLTANGEPTSNAALSIPYTDIKASDNYGFVVDFEEYFDGTG